jgi:hypothetical protein
MKPSLILNAIQDQLQASTNLSYVSDSNILLGVRERIPLFPCILIEPINLDETEFAYTKQRLTLSIAIMGYIQVTDMDKQFVGDANIKGILDIENDIKLALDSDRTLAGNAMHVIIRNSVYDFVNYPVRSVTINVDILLEQTKATR